MSLIFFNELCSNSSKRIVVRFKNETPKARLILRLGPRDSYRAANTRKNIQIVLSINLNTAQTHTTHCLENADRGRGRRSSAECVSRKYEPAFSLVWEYSALINLFSNKACKKSMLVFVLQPSTIGADVLYNDFPRASTQCCTDSVACEAVIFQICKRSSIHQDQDFRLEMQIEIFSVSENTPLGCAPDGIFERIDTRCADG